MDINGIILINKKQDFTSFQTINLIKKNLGIKKIGHTGTLDKNATGLLVVCLGKATKLCKYLVEDSKRYIAMVEFGRQTTTDDANGETVREYKGNIDFEVIKDKLELFKGKIKQIPPDYSSVSINGKRAYKLALEGKKPSIKERIVYIYNQKILSFDNNILKLDIECSSGTYIRAIARDLGRMTGYFAYLKELQRISVGKYTIENSVFAEDITKENIKVIKPLDVLTDFCELQLKENFLGDVRNGKRIKKEWFFITEPIKDGVYKLSCNNELVAIIKVNNSNFFYDLVF